jgi:hypothetical protein
MLPNTHGTGPLEHPVSCFSKIDVIILANPLHGNDRETSNDTKAIAKEQFRKCDAVREIPLGKYIRKKN